MTRKDTWFHPELNRHKAVGIDIDGTLINGINSNALQRWIEAYHDEIEFHLITFRDSEDVKQAPDDIMMGRGEMKWFKGLHSIPAEIIDPFNWNYVHIAVALRNGQIAKAKRTLAHRGVPWEEWIDIDAKAREWKGLKCKELGLTAMIDDIPTMVLPGCEKHGIEFFNVNSLRIL